MGNGWGGARPGAGRKQQTHRRIRSEQPIVKPGQGMTSARMLATARASIERARMDREAKAAQIDVFRPAEPPPGVLPNGMKAADVMAMDSASIVDSLGWAQNVFAQVVASGLTFLGYPFLSELAQRPEYRIISETIGTEMTRKWIRLKAKGDENKDEKIAELNDYMRALQVQDRFCDLAVNDGLFGRSHLFIRTKDVDIDSNPKELATPIGDGLGDLSKSKVNVKNPLVGLKVIEPLWTYPQAYNATQPLKDNWYNPDQWYVMGVQVERTRLIPFVGRPVPDLLKPAYSFGGLSLSQMAKPYVDNWLRTRQSVADIIHSFSVMVLSTDLDTILSTGAEQLFLRTELFTNLRDNNGAMVINKNTEDLKNVAAPLGTLDMLQAQTQEHMAAVSRIPLVKLLGIQPMGLNATAEGELRAFFDTIGAAQVRLFTPRLWPVIRFCMLSLWGEVDPDIEFDWVPLWSLDEKAEAELEKAHAETDQVLIDSGIISQEEARKRVAGDPKSPYQGLDPDDVPDLLEEEEQGLEPEGGRPQPVAEGEEDQGGERGGASDAVGPFPGRRHAMRGALDEWQESQHPRDTIGKFAEGAGGGSSAIPDAPSLWTNLTAALAAHSDTPEVVQTGLPVPIGEVGKGKKSAFGGLWKGGEKPTAQNFGLNVESVLNGKTNAGQTYRLMLMFLAKNAANYGYGDKVDDLKTKLVEAMELGHAKAEAAGKHDEAQKIAVALAKIGKVAPKLAQAGIIAAAKQAGAKVEVPKPAPAPVPEPEPKVPEILPQSFPKPTAAELEKAKKSVKLQAPYVPGATALETDKAKALAQKEIDAFNVKYEGKMLAEPAQLAAKVNDFKMLGAKVAVIAKAEAENKAAAAAAAKKALADKAKEDHAELAELMKEFGFDNNDAKAVQGFLELAGGNKEKVIKELKTGVSNPALKGMTSFEHAMLQSYTGSAYASVNAALRKGSWSVKQHIYIAAVNKALKKLPSYQGETVRFAPLSVEQQVAYQVGQVVEERAFTSTSKNKNWAWSGNTKLLVTGKNGRDIQHLSKHTHEAEVLYPAHSFFVVDKVEGKPGGHMTVYITEVEAH